MARTNVGAPIENQNIYGLGLRKLVIIPFSNERGLVSPGTILVPLKEMLSKARYNRKALPEKDIIPKTVCCSDKRDRMRIVINTMGRSVIRGLVATLIPSLILCLRVSVITSVNKGPGTNPLKPKTKPDIIYVISTGI